MISRYLSPKAVAELLGIVKVDIVLAAIHAGELVAADVSRPNAKRPTWRISPTDLDAFLASRRAVPPPPVVRHTRRQKMKNVIEFF